MNERPAASRQSSHGRSTTLLTRREMLGRTGMGFGTLALTQLLGGAGLLERAAADTLNPLAPKTTHFPAKAKRVIHLFMNGGPSHVDTFDPKPELTARHGQELPINLPTERKTGAAFASPFKFQKYGQSGIEVSELFSHVGERIDDICVIRSMHGDSPNHEPSLLLMNCGEARLIRPSMGSWLTYGLGSENQNLPGFIAMCPGGYPIQESQNWQAGFLPGVYQGTYIDTKHTQVDRLIEHIDNRMVSSEQQRRQLDLLRQLNERASRRAAGRRPARSAHSVVRAGLSHADAKRPTRSTSAASRSTSSTCTGPARRPGRS